MTDFAQGLSNEASVLKDVVLSLPSEVGHRLLDDVQHHLGKVVVENAAGAGLAMLLSRSPAGVAFGLTAAALAGAGIDMYKIGSKAWGANTDAERKEAVSYGTNLIGGQAAALIESTPGVLAGSLGPSLYARMFKPIPAAAGEAPLAALTSDAPIVGKTATEGADLGAAAKVEAAKPNVIAFNEREWLGQGDQGIVYDNNNGTVTKVLTDPDLTAAQVKSIHDSVGGMGVNVPKVLETGVTADGRQAVVLQKVGNGDNLSDQLLMGEVGRDQLPEISRQYYQMADALKANNSRVDWRIKNMAWDDGKLWLLDPSFLKQGIMNDDYLSLMGGSIILPRAKVLPS